jgi:hypothetical protein
VKIRTRVRFTFWRWNALFMASYGVGHAMLVVLAGLVLKIGARTCLALYLLLLGCGGVVSVLIYWARQSYDRPKSGSIRFALAIFFFLNLYMGVLLVSTVKLGILSRSSALDDYAPYIFLSSALGSIVVYAVVRRSLEASQSG